MRRELFLIALASVAGGAAAADVYKWTDAGGVVHYSDTEPPAATAPQKLRVAGSIATKPADAATPPPEPAPAAAPADQLVPGAAGAQLRCDQARKNLEVLQGAGSVGIDDGTGKARPLDNATRDAEIARSQAVIARNCK